jgi:signal transduction histidine kinase
MRRKRHPTHPGRIGSSTMGTRRSRALQGRRKGARLFLVSWLGALVLLFGIGAAWPGRGADPVSGQIQQAPLTNIWQLRTLPIEDYLRRLRFHLVGTVTLVDTNRGIVVLQDETGAVAMDARGCGVALRPGLRVSIQGTNASPYLAGFPDYPYRPSGWDMRNSFEAPSNWGDYHLTRMRGWLHPPATGDYTFWIASDNSSELWLSPDDDPGKVRRIAFVREWVSPHEWLREPGQRSETIFFRAGQTYYIEACQEQLTEDEHLSVAWQGPGLNQAIVDGRYLTPWIENLEQAPFASVNGVLREYWTNYFAGSLVGISGPKPFDGALSAEEMRVAVLGEAPLPAPKRIPLGQPMQPEDRYRWVEAEGTILFAGNNGESAILELTDGLGEAQVRLSNWTGNWPVSPRDWRVRVRGVCEGVRTSNGVLMPDLIWASGTDGLSFISPPATNQDSLRRSAPNPLAPTNASPALGGFYITYGVVTFNDRVFGKDCFFIQGDNAAIAISQEARPWGRQIQVGQWVEVGGDVIPGRYIPTLLPLNIRLRQWRSMPEPLDVATAGNKDGRWTELEGVVRSVNPDGTLTVAGKNDATLVWIGQLPTNLLSRYVDSALRVRGVMSLTLLESPLLLVPSRSFVQIEEEPPANPFEIPLRPISHLDAAGPGARTGHRVKIAGVVTYTNQRSLFVQDASGGARVLASETPPAGIGDLVEVAGFPEKDAAVPTLTAALLRPTGATQTLLPPQLHVSEVAAGGYGGMLIRMTAGVLRSNARGVFQVVELEDPQGVFEALLSSNLGNLPPLAPGSRVQVTGVCDAGSPASPADGKAGLESSPVKSCRIWLRSPMDVIVLSGPPWWTWKRITALVEVLLAVLVGAVLWIYLLRRRLHRQQATQLAFARQILQTQEGERRRIAANLHDSLGQNLLVIKNQAWLAMQPAKDEAQSHQRLDEITSLASQAIEEVRRITHSLRPYQLDRLGLSEAIRAAINGVSENSGIVFASDVEMIDKLFDEEAEIHIYRIVQESLNNIVKHSGASEATVVIKRQEGNVSLSVRDNGRGFDSRLVQDPALDAGLGLRGITERARILGGHLTVDSRPGEGTSIRIEIPVPAP